MEKHIAVAINSEGGVWHDHFGMAPQYAIYDGQGQRVGTRENPYGIGQPEEKDHGHPQETLDLLNDCNVFIATVTGYYPVQVQRLGIELFITDAADPDSAVSAYLSAEN